MLMLSGLCLGRDSSLYHDLGLFQTTGDWKSPHMKSWTYCLPNKSPPESSSLTESTPPTSRILQTWQLATPWQILACRIDRPSFLRSPNAYLPQAEPRPTHPREEPPLRVLPHADHPSLLLLLSTLRRQDAMSRTSAAAAVLHYGMLHDKVFAGDILVYRGNWAFCCGLARAIANGSHAETPRPARLLVYPHASDSEQTSSLGSQVRFYGLLVGPT